MCKVGRMRNSILALVALLGGCGDNSRSCGDGTIEMNGFCVPAGCGVGTVTDEETGECVPDGTIVCSNGTRFDPATSQCQIDPAACQHGTVLVDGACVDPATGMVASLSEGPEPNSMNVIEVGDSRAGNIVLGAAAFVIHGTIAPHSGAPDVDTYVLEVAEPTLVHVSADGLGINTAFVVLSPGISGWQRFAINLAGDTSQRDVFLPIAGTYLFAISDTATMFDYADTGTATTASASGEYYVSIAPHALPAPTALTSMESGTLASGGLAFYAATVPNGAHPITVAMPSEFAVSSVVITAGQFFAFDDEDTTAARITTAGIGEALIVVDHVYALSPSSVAYSVSIQ
jgi:hypothetical protein